MPSAPGDLQALAQALIAATDRAADVQGAQNLAADFGSLRNRVTEAVSELETLRAVLSSARLKPAPADVDPLDECRRTLQGLLPQVKASVAANPVGLRRGNLWRQTDAAMTAVVVSSGTAIDNAFARLVLELPSPEPGLIAAVPPGTAGIDAYRGAIARYEQVRVDPPRTPEALEKFIAVAEKLGELQQQLLHQAVPTEHRVQWQQLQQGQLALTQFTDDFRAWLETRGMLGNVYLRFLAS